jgi:hypothetical protein
MLVSNTGAVGEGGAKTAKRARFRLTPTIKSFGKDRSGNIMFLFAFMTTVLFLFAGGAVDYTRWNAVRADMIESMDAASLALAQLAASDPSLTNAELEVYGKKFFEANFNFESNLDPGWEIDFSLDDDAVVATCITGKIDTYLLGVAGIEKLNIDKCVEITKKGSGRVELALVLDVTGSMNDSISGVKKINSLKSAVTIMLDVMYGTDAESENLKIGVVPFNAYVNAGASTGWSNDWADTNAEAYYHGKRFFHVDSSGNVDMNTKVNHFNLYNSHANLSWGGCVEMRPYPLDELDVPPDGSITTTELNDAMDVPAGLVGTTNTYKLRTVEAYDDAPGFKLSTSILTDTVNLKWVPVFLPDESDCNDTDDCDNGDYSESGTTTYGTPWAGYMFDDPDSDGGHSSGTIYESSYGNRSFINDWEYTNYLRGSRFDKYAKTVYYFREVLMGNVTDTAFKNFLSDLSITTTGSNGYGNQEYLLRMAYVGWWDPDTSTYLGKYDIAPSLSSSNGPALSCPPALLPLTNVRATVDDYVDALSPSGNTNSAHGAAWGWRVLSKEAPFVEGIGEGDVDYEKWQKAVVIMTDGENTVGSDSYTHWNTAHGIHGYGMEERMGAGMNTSSEMRDEIDNKLLRVCQRMKDEGYVIYTIMFGLDSTSTEEVFKACASKPTAPYFNDAATGEDLEEAFGDIAADLVDLHISK